MNWRKEFPKILTGLGVFLLLYFLPFPQRFSQGLSEGLWLAHWYAREHVIFCLIPAFFVAGAISTFLAQDAILRYLGPKAPRPLAYGVASVSGTILAVCSCTILPLFAGIYMRGAGIGPATTFLYAGPALNLLAIVLTARVLGSTFGVARAGAAISVGILIGLVMALVFRAEESKRMEEFVTPQDQRPYWAKTGLFMATLLIWFLLLTWGPGRGVWGLIHAYKWPLVALWSLLLFGESCFFFGVSFLDFWATILLVALVDRLIPGHTFSFLIGVLGFSLALFRAGGWARQWLDSSYFLARQILPLLFLGVWGAGFFLGRPGHEGFIPSSLVTHLVGGNSLGANLFAALLGAFMYFATLTEIPILQGLLGAGMGYGPALALLLSGPAVSLPSILVIRSVLGTKKTLVYLGLVVFFSSLCGFLFGKWG